MKSEAETRQIESKKSSSCEIDRSGKIHFFPEFYFLNPQFYFLSQFNQLIETRSSAQGNCSAKSRVAYVSSQLEAEI